MIRRILSWLGAVLLAAVTLVGQAATGVGGVTGGGHRLRHQPQQPAHAPVRPGQRRRPARRSWSPCTTAPAPGPAFYSGTEFAPLADRYGFIVIYPSATRSGNCFDVYTPEALRRNGGSDPVGIVSMVSYVQQRYNADPNRIFVTGASSGAMMTNVLLGDYPDVFKAGAAFTGVPFACFATTPPNTWNSECANGQVIRTPQQWGDLVRNAYPGYTGARPRMQIWHGTNDTRCATRTSASRSSSGPTCTA